MGKIFSITSSDVPSTIIEEISNTIINGGVILYPTDTIYGLGCNAYDEIAVKKIFEIKGREETKPLLLLARSISMLEELVDEIPPIAEKLLQRFSPGPLTIIFRASKKIPLSVTAHSGNVGIRIPSSKFCMALLNNSNIPLVSTSANLTGQETPSSVKELERTFSQKVDVFINGGNLPPSPPSTIVDVTDKHLRLIRAGAISAEQLAPFL